MALFVYWMAGVLFLLVVLPVMCFHVHIRIQTLEKLYRPQLRTRRRRRRCCQQQNSFSVWHCNRDGVECGEINDRNGDRQGNIFTIHNDTTSSMIANRYTDIFYIEPNNGEGARIPSQQEKDDKELPTYEEVMRMTNQTVSAALLSNATGSVMAASSASVNTTDTTLTVPPYSEIDPNANMIAPPVTGVPSTSHPTALNEVSSCTSPTTTSTATTVTPSLSTNTQIHTSSV